jgi:hypothetical protein
MDYIHRPILSIDHDVSETGSVSETSWSIEIDRTMDIVHKHSSLVHHVPSSNSFQAYLSFSVSTAGDTTLYAYSTTFDALRP